MARDRQKRIMSKVKVYPNGIREFDHSRFAELPEYRAASRALDALAHAIYALPGRDPTQREWLTMVSVMAAALPYSDGCERCLGEEVLPDWPEWIHAPLTVSIEDGWVIGRYHCPRHDRVWTCHYSIDFPELTS